jgi:hypothetical protein
MYFRNGGRHYIETAPPPATPPAPPPPLSRGFTRPGVNFTQNFDTQKQKPFLVTVKKGLGLFRALEFL